MPDQYKLLINYGISNRHVNLSTIGVVGKQKRNVYYYFIITLLLLLLLLLLWFVQFTRTVFFAPSFLCLYLRVLRTSYLLTLFLYLTVRLWSHQINKGKLNWVTIIEIHLPNPTCRNLLKHFKNQSLPAVGACKWRHANNGYHGNQVKVKWSTRNWPWYTWR